MANTSFKDLLPLSIGDKHIINDSYVNQFDIAHRDKQDVTKIGKEAFEYELYLKGNNALQLDELKELPKKTLSFIATIPDSFEYGDEDVSINIETNAESYDGEILNESIAHYNRTLDTITPLKVGETEIVFTATKGREREEYRHTIRVVDEIVGTPDHTSEPRFTDEELALVMLNRDKYEIFKSFTMELYRLLSPPDDENFGYSQEHNIHEATNGLYQSIRENIDTLRSTDKISGLRAISFDELREACLYVNGISSILGIQSVSIWWDEVPTLISTSENYQEITNAVNTLLPKYFIIPMTTKEDFVFNYYLSILNGSVSGSYIDALNVIENYIVSIYTNSKWFKDKLKYIKLSIIESYVGKSVPNGIDYSSQDDSKKRDILAYYLTQTYLGSKSNGRDFSKEQIVLDCVFGNNRVILNDTNLSRINRGFISFRKTLVELIANNENAIDKYIATPFEVLKSYFIKTLEYRNKQIQVMRNNNARPIKTPVNIQSYNSVTINKELLLYMIYVAERTSANPRLDVNMLQKIEIIAKKSAYFPIAEAYMNNFSLDNLYQIQTQYFDTLGDMYRNGFNNIDERRMNMAHFTTNQAFVAEHSYDNPTDKFAWIIAEFYRHHSRVNVAHTLQFTAHSRYQEIPSTKTLATLKQFVIDSIAPQYESDKEAKGQECIKGIRDTQVRGIFEIIEGIKSSISNIRDYK